MKKRVLALLLLATMVFGLAGCSEKKTETPQDSGLSGKVVIYTSMYEDVIEIMDEALAEAFPDVDIEFFYGGTGTLQSKVAAEMEAGKLGCDMLMVAEPAYSLELKELGYLHAYQSAVAENLRFEYDEEGYWYPVRVCNMVLAYNPELYSKEELPNSFYDFANDESVKGMISMGNPLSSGTTMASIVALQDKYGDEFFAALGNQDVTVESGSVALTKLETGECKEIMILEESVLKKREEEGSKLEVIYPTDGNILIPSTIMTVAAEKSANNNTAACEAITDWFLSEAGQQYVTSAWMHSVLKDFAEIPYDSRATEDCIAENMPVDWVRCYTEREAIRTLFQENVTIPQ